MHSEWCSSYTVSGSMSACSGNMSTSYHRRGFIIFSLILVPMFIYGASRDYGNFKRLADFSLPPPAHRNTSNPFLTQRKRSLRLGRKMTIVYNRVGKCGSRAINNIIFTLGAKNQLKCKHSLIYDKLNVTGEAATKLAASIMKLPKPSFFERHFYFINFENVTKGVPFYINVVREPVSQYVSFYYYMRAAHKEMFTDEEYHMLLDDCVLKKHKLCGKKNEMMEKLIAYRYFCGPDQECRQPTSAALQQAKYHVEKHYSVVGILEDIERFYSVLEFIFPQYFSGAVDLYKENKRSLKKKYKNKKRTEPKPEVVAILKNRLKFDIDFYEWIKYKFNKNWNLMRQHQFQNLVL